MMVCRDFNVSIDGFHELADYHHIEYEDKYDLANKAMIGIERIRRSKDGI